jgi:Rrf2 family protein
MLALTKKTDYAFIALHHMGTLRSGEFANAKEIAAMHRIPPELLAKILQTLVKKSLVTSLAGPKGGYALARPLSRISAGEVVRAIEGELQFTRCHDNGGAPCQQIVQCTVRTPLQRIQDSVIALLDATSLEQLMLPESDAAVTVTLGRR